LASILADTRTLTTATPLTTGILFSRVIGALDRAGIRYMLTGSFASSYHGSPRATQDIDIVRVHNAKTDRDRHDTA
jgi:hypothetical protein